MPKSISYNLSTSIIPGLVAAVTVGLLSHLFDQSHAASITSAVAILCVFWWIFEPIPIPVTSLVPMALLPLLGVISPADVGAAYGSPLILLLMGGFLLSKGMESTGAHTRIALTVVRLVGANEPRRLILGFMLAAALLSMWISNTATVLTAVSFSEWMTWGIPVVALMVPTIALFLARQVPNDLTVALPDIGEWRSAEKRVLVIFALTALAWMTRTEPFGGWREWLDMPMANDAAVAFCAVIAMFVSRDKTGEPLISWEQASAIPWGVLLLFAGGITLAKGFVASGLSTQVGELLANLALVPTLFAIVMVAILVTALTEATSNTATTALLMPILAAASMAAQIDPLILMVPAAMSASCAFMLPVATAPNAVVFGTGQIGIQTMVRWGIWVNVLGVLVISAVVFGVTAAR